MVLNPKLNLRHLPSALVTLLLLPIVARRYFRASTGRAYGLGLGTKLRLLVAMVRNTMLVPFASDFIAHLLMAAVRRRSKVSSSVLECNVPGSTSSW